VKGELALLFSIYPNVNNRQIYGWRSDLKIQGLPNILRERGYNTLWISGFRATYGKKKKFLSRHGVNEFYDGSDLPEDVPKLGWGLPDVYMFEYAADILDRQTTPFFAEITTVSNHWPCTQKFPTIPETPVLYKRADQYSMYTRGIYYTDHAVGHFMDIMRTKSYFDNTIFVFTSDHGIFVFPKNANMKTVNKQEAYFRAPMIFYAPKLIKPDVLDIVASHVDFTPTILHMLGIRAKNGFVGRSMLAPVNELPRYALMMHVKQWNLRVNNHYVYDVGREIFYEHFPTTNRGQVAPEDNHVFLICNEDLMWIKNPDLLRYGPENEREQYYDWGDELVKHNTYFLKHNSFSDIPLTESHSNGN